MSWQQAEDCCPPLPKSLLREKRTERERKEKTKHKKVPLEDIDLGNIHRGIWCLVFTLCFSGIHVMYLCQHG
ncbi:hypothetical protein POX_e06701 [Penicillium oxalicum]|uniref:Uncharacterized protein n=1 Tax=Penicillium oxalicum (strain 114-2 / CGMCC 5302) TaxID=933388 RepID=S7ZBV2_PENO1|nr:hypothetical protein POX_e06701 [Penicillium oxalicum]EPS27719.1 hypothetical protein PDE_02663 [Penicillium oxalicum 114-2]KAI2788680.1 hypothetical protein POX_e06701 [Penicillium oxalicum]